MNKANLLLVLILGIIKMAKAQPVMRLYDGKAPGSENWTWTEKISTTNAANIRLVYNVSEPTLTAYLP